MKKYTIKHLLLCIVLKSVVVFTCFTIYSKSDAQLKVNLKSAASWKIDINHSTTPMNLKLNFIFPPKEKNNSVKYILYWSPMWDSKTFSFGSEGYELFKHCRYKNCFATHDKKLIPVEEFDAIIFHTAQYNEKLHGKPRNRKQNQRYIFATLEPPTRAYPTNLHKFRSFYNWTMTYRYDSDIIRPYGYTVKSITKNYKILNVESMKQKTHLLAWFVSNCHTINRRYDLYKNLRRYVDIDVYGSCGKLKCPKKFHESSSKCYDLIESKYKFYLSFENSHCKDYATEKLYKLLLRNIVPVVYGNNDYDKIAPPYSVIVADNFTNPKDLVEYLLFLDRNPTEYLKYFEWKKSYRIEINGNRTVCRLCRMLNDAFQPTKIYKDIFLWWLGSNHSYCKLGDGLPSISVPIE